jgi:hypothetical protein
VHSPAASALAASLAEDLQQHPTVAERIMALADSTPEFREAELQRTARGFWGVLDRSELADALNRLRNPSLFTRVISHLRSSEALRRDLASASLN